ncbi:kinase-like protein [Sistotremastrum suecicum HHB10207 ss-3]|uniref:Kinase-like protein n=1 Tax=Sistotremastrum suecicum HHB10207 ss-3 TaxID=1314776 RepID=A0A165XWG5_9AGAM|nr:kinase-like protein [Sistotremastrum suecicum HHB10207 ss-3]
MENVENIDGYTLGGYHPVAIGDVLGEGRYRILNKLGHGGASTAWLARDLHAPQDLSAVEGLVTLKIMFARLSSIPLTEPPDLYISHKIHTFASSIRHTSKESIHTVRNHFFEESPNGRHLCLVSEFAGPSLRSLFDWFNSGMHWQKFGNRPPHPRRMRGDLCRKFAKQLANAVELTHSAGFIHADLTPSNILLKISKKVLSAHSVDQIFGVPVTEELELCEGRVPSPSAPKEVVAPMHVHHFCFPSPPLIKDEILLIDFGVSLDSDHPLPPDYYPPTPIPYASPENLLESTTGSASDVWSLGCIIFEMRTTRPLFDTFFHTRDAIFQEIVFTLGKLPNPWWTTWKSGSYEEEGWFDEISDPTKMVTIRQKLLQVGTNDDHDADDRGSMAAKPGTRIDEEEIDLLEDLLLKMLKIHPEERITMREVVRHPWFDY